MKRPRASGAAGRSANAPFPRPLTLRRTLAAVIAAKAKA